MTLPPFPDTVIPASPEERLRLIAYGELCARAGMERVTQALGDLSFECFGGIGTCAPSVETYNRTFGVLEEARAAIDAARGDARQRASAPWSDFAGNPIRDGDTIRHPGGEIGRVVYQPEGETESDRWRVDYGTGTLSRLVLQVGDKGQAVVLDAARGAGKGGGE